MIRIILLGRTGNHLFQYALGRVLAARHGVPLVLDASWFNAEGWAEVSHFLKSPIRARVTRKFSLASRLLRNTSGKHFWELGGHTLFREPADDQSFSQVFLDAPADCVLFGYFQSHRYFENSEEELRTEILGILDSARTDRTAEATDSEFTSPQSVAVHVRRGDYLRHPVFNLCTLQYYRAAMERMRQMVPGARFLIYSDDPDWCRGNFTEADVRTIPHDKSSSNPLHDLRRMSLAGHHIIANSSYSWWAAWLGKKGGQQVLMPDRWYSGEIKAPIEDKRLPHWKTIPLSSL